MKDIILKAEGVQKTFANNGSQIHVLSDVNLEIYKGDFTVIMGSSGSGKLTLLYALSGMDGATSGRVLYYPHKDSKEAVGENIDVVKVKESQLSKLRINDFGFVFQQMHLISNLSLFENVAVTGYLNKKVSAADTNKRTAELLERMGLSEISDHLPSQVSGGEQ